MDKHTLNISEVAELIGISRQAVSCAAKRGEIPCLRIGHQTLFSRAMIEEYIRSGSFPSAEPPQTDAAEIARQVVTLFLDALPAALEAVQDPPKRPGRAEPSFGRRKSGAA